MQDINPNRSRRRWLQWGGALACVALFASVLVWWMTPSEQTLRLRCRTYRKEAKWQQLSQTAEYWTRRQPQSGEAWLFRAEAAQGLKDFDRLAEYLGRVPANDKRAIPAWVQRAGLLFEQLNRPEEAVETCYQILKVDPGVAIARQRIIFYYALTLQRAKLIHEVREALKVQREPPEAYIYLVGSQWLYFGNLYEQNGKWLESSPNNEIYEVARAMQVIISNAKDHPQRALEFKDVPDAEELLRRYPHNVEVLSFHLEKRITDGDVETVGKLLAAAPAQADLDPRIWYARGWLHDVSGDVAKAREAYQKSLEIDPYGWQVYHQLADLYRRMGQREQVKKCELLYAEGKTLRETITRLPDAQSAPAEVLQQIKQYAERCGDVQVVSCLKNRL